MPVVTGVPVVGGGGTDVTGVPVVGGGTVAQRLRGWGMDVVMGVHGRPAGRYSPLVSELRQARRRPACLIDDRHSARVSMGVDAGGDIGARWCAALAPPHLHPIGELVAVGATRRTRGVGGPA